MKRQFFVTVCQVFEGSLVRKKTGYLIYVGQQLPQPTEENILRKRKRDFPREIHGPKDRIQVSEAVYHYYCQRPVFAKEYPVFKKVFVD